MKLNRRHFHQMLGAAALPLFSYNGSASAATAPIQRSSQKKIIRGSYLIKNAALISVDPKIGTLPQADILVHNGVIERIGQNLSEKGVEIINASDMIVMPGFVNTHYHMWSAIGRSFTAAKEGFSYYPAKGATAEHYTAQDFYHSVMLASVELVNGGTTTVHNWSHNTRSPAHADAELRAHQHSLMRARYAYGHKDKLAVDTVNGYEDISRIRKQWFGNSDQFEGLVHLGLNLRGTLQSDEAVFHEEMAFVRKSGLPAAIHAPQEMPNNVDAVLYEKLGYLGPDFLIAHYLSASDADLAAMARTHTPVSFATHSELRLSSTGDARAMLMRMRAAGLSISLSSDASSIAPPDMFEAMRFTWNLGVPWKGTSDAQNHSVDIAEVIQMATLNGAIALGLSELTGSITEGKRADLIMLRANDLNMAPVSNIETAVVQSATSSNVDMVMIDGKIVKRSGRLVAYDTSRIVGDAKASAQRVRSAAGALLKS